MEEKKNNKKKILIYSILGIITVLIVTLTITYAYWILTRQQTGENIVNTACLNISFTGENDITLDKAYPMNDEQLDKFLSTETPYHFTIHNECSELASATINLESLNAGAEKQLEDQYINAILYEDDYHNNLNSVKKLNASIYNDENKVIANSLHAYSLYNFNLKPDETRDFNLLLYMDPDTPMEEENMNASWKGKITLSTGYKEDSKALRKISSSDTNGMWGYKDKLTKIVIEDSKSVKEAPDGGKVYGPFDESEYGTKAVESYVVCEADDTNCVGYLQSEGKVIANSDSSYLFASFPNVTEIIGLEKLDVSQVSIMIGMFMDSGLASIDLSMWNTSKVTNVGGLFGGNLININLSNWDFTNVSYVNGIFNRNVQTINLTNAIFSKDSSSMFSTSSNIKHIILDNVDTSKVTNMYGMFANLSNLEELDLSSFDTTNVTDMGGMFDGCSQLKTLNLSNFNTVNVKNFSRIFASCGNLLDLDLSNWDLSNINSVALFTGLSNLQTVNMTNFVFPTNSSNFFYGITNIYGINNLSKIVLYNVDTSHVTNMYGMFAGCSSLSSLDLSSFDTSNVTDMSGMFQGTTGLQSITFGSKFVHKSEATTIGMFSGCPAPERPTGDTWNDVSFN